MPSPFPGMDPYLESPDIWPDVHAKLITEIQNALNPALRPTYVARVELRVYITDPDDPAIEVIVPDLRIEESGATAAKKSKQTNGAAIALVKPEIIPYQFDDEIKEARLEIRHRKSGALVTIIEVVSPANKIRGSQGRKSFLEKRRETRAADVHWVEIDLLRGGSPSVALLKPSDHRIVMYRAKERKGRYWRINMREPLPAIGIPLRGKDADVPLELSKVLNAAYDHAAYDLSLNYSAEPDPPFAKEDKTWAHQLLRGRGLR
jgi:Protein of unknown function (DUF4058)